MVVSRNGTELTGELGQRSKPAVGQRDKGRHVGPASGPSPLCIPLLVLLYSSVPQQEGPMWARSCSNSLTVKTGVSCCLWGGVRLGISVRLTTWTLVQSGAVPSLLLTCSFTMFNTSLSNISTEAKSFRGGSLTV